MIQPDVANNPPVSQENFSLLSKQVSSFLTSVLKIKRARRNSSHSLSFGVFIFPITLFLNSSYYVTAWSSFRPNLINDIDSPKLSKVSQISHFFRFGKISFRVFWENCYCDLSFSPYSDVKFSPPRSPLRCFCSPLWETSALSLPSDKADKIGIDKNPFVWHSKWKGHKWFVFAAVRSTKWPKSTWRVAPFVKRISKQGRL